MTTTDRELLERAAKAAGIALHFINDQPKEVTEHWPCDPTEGPQEREWDWNPLTDDGDALRLAVKLGLGVIQWGDEVVSATHATTNREFSEIYGSDPFAATRRAIVRAAAAMAGEGE